MDPRVQAGARWLTLVGWTLIGTTLAIFIAWLFLIPAAYRIAFNIQIASYQGCECPDCLRFYGITEPRPRGSDQVDDALRKVISPLALGIGAACIGSGLSRRSRRSRTADVCPHCTHNLAGLTADQCPECGSPVPSHPCHNPP